MVTIQPRLYKNNNDEVTEIPQKISQGEEYQNECKI